MARREKPSLERGGSDAAHGAVGLGTGPGTVRNAPVPRAGSVIAQERAICEKPARCSLWDRVQQPAEARYGPREIVARTVDRTQFTVLWGG